MQNSSGRNLMDSLLSPRSVALVGISESPANMCRQIYEAMSIFGSAATIYFVNPRRDQVLSMKCYPSLGALPEIPDVAVIAIPREGVLDTLTEGAKRGLKSAIVLTSGFAEGRSPRGLELQQQLMDLAERTGLRICGPNCIGLVNFSAGHALIAAAGTASFKANISPGRMSLASQSGGLLISLLGYMAESTGSRLGLRFAVSSGNEADLKSADYLEYFLEDEGTDVIGLILEGVGEGRRLKELAREALEIGKPIVVLKIGRTPVGRIATVAHTGNMAGEYEVMTKILREEGVVFADSIVDFVEIAALLQFAKRVSYHGTGVSAIALSGGTAGLTADLGTEKGLQFLNYPENVVNEIRSHLPDFGTAGNPLDLTAASLSGDSTPIFEKVSKASPDAVLLVAPLKRAEKDNNPGIRALIEQFCRFSGQSDKFGVVVSTISGSLGEYWSEYSKSLGVPFTQDIEKGLLAVSKLLEFSAARKRRESRSAEMESTDSGMPRLQDLAGYRGLQELGGTKLLGEKESKRLFKEMGLPVTAGVLVSDSDEAVRCAEKMGYPVVLKLAAPGVAHKSEVDGVVIDLRTSVQVVQAYDRIMSAAKAHDIALSGILVQEMIQDGIEVYIGVKQDPDFGPIILYGTGGIFVELLRDYTFKLVPLRCREEAVELIGATRSGALLRGFRGRKDADVDALADLLVRVSQFAHVNRDVIKAIDLNPVFVLEKGSGVKIADSLIDLF